MLGEAAWSAESPNSWCSHPPPTQGLALYACIVGGTDGRWTGPGFWEGSGMKDWPENVGCQLANTWPCTPDFRRWEAIEKASQRRTILLWVRAI